MLTPGNILIQKAGFAAGKWLAGKVAVASQVAVEKAAQLAEQAKQAAAAKAAQVLTAAERAAQAAVAKAKQLAEAADNAARTEARQAQGAFVDALSNDVAAVSGAYQSGKAAVTSAKASVSKGIDAVKQLVGVQSSASVVQSCPYAGNAPPPDGSLMIPSDVPGACESGYIPIPPANAGGTQAAIATAKTNSVASTSACCAGKPATERNRTIFYVNGVNTTPESHCKTLKMIRDMTCAKVIGINNSTEGLATDAIRTGDARDMIKQEIDGGPQRSYAGFTPSVKTMQDAIFSEAAAGRPVEIYAHSEGGAITSLAATRAKAALATIGRSGNLSNVKITSMGAAAPAWPDGPKYEHLIHNEDIIPNTLGLGDAAKRPGAGAVITRFGGRNGQYITEGDVGYKRAWLPFTKSKDPLADHYADTSYLPYMNQPRGQRPGGCL